MLFARIGSGVIRPALLKWNNFNFSQNQMLFKRPLFFKQAKKGKTEEPRKMVTSIDFEALERSMKEALVKFDSSVKDIKFGKLTPETFKSITLFQYGKNQAVMDLGQIIPINAGQVEFIPYEKDVLDKVIKVLNKDTTYDFQIELKEESIVITSQNMNTQVQRKKILASLEGVLKKYKEYFSDLRREENKKIASYGKDISEDLKQRALKELASICEQFNK